MKDLEWLDEVKSSPAIKFWRPNESHGCFSNFSIHNVVIDNVDYKTTEHYYQAMKFLDEKSRILVNMAATPKLSKITAYYLMDRAKEDDTILLRPDWDNVKFEIMKTALRAKVEQHSEVKETLIKTGETILQEDSPYDFVWGIGSDGSGQNLLGKAWMEIRKEIM